MQTPEQSEVLQIALDAFRRSLHTALPGIVKSYDADTQTAVITPALTRSIPTAEEGVFTTRPLPDIPGVPVAWPRGGEHYVHFDLEPGDGVLLVICESDPSGWLRTGRISDPGDLRRHSIAHAWAIPGYGPGGAGAAKLGDVGVVAPKGEFGGSDDAAALASLLDKLIAVLKNVTPGAGSDTAAKVLAAFPSVTAPTTPTGPLVTSTGSAVLKVGG